MPTERTRGGPHNEILYLYECPVPGCQFEGCAGDEPWAWYRMGPHLEAHLTNTLRCDRCETTTPTVNLDGHCPACSACYS